MNRPFRVELGRGSGCILPSHAHLPPQCRLACPLHVQSGVTDHMMTTVRSQSSIPSQEMKTIAHARTAHTGTHAALSPCLFSDHTYTQRKGHGRNWRKFWQNLGQRKKTGSKGKPDKKCQKRQILTMRYCLGYSSTQQSNDRDTSGPRTLDLHPISLNSIRGAPGANSQQNWSYVNFHRQPNQTRGRASPPCRLSAAAGAVYYVWVSLLKVMFNVCDD